MNLQTVLHWVFLEFSWEVDVSWLFVIIKSYVKVTLRKEMIIIMLPASRELVISIDYWRNALLAMILFSIWVLFHVLSWFTGQQGKGKAIYLTPLYRFRPFHRHLDISWALTAESSHLHIANSRTRTGVFRAQVTNH